MVHTSYAQWACLPSTYRKKVCTLIPTRASICDYARVKGVCIKENGPSAARPREIRVIQIGFGVLSESLKGISENNSV